jgi:hypothetical protein
MADEVEWFMWELSSSVARSDKPPGFLDDGSSANIVPQGLQT